MMNLTVCQEENLLKDKTLHKMFYDKFEMIRPFLEFYPSKYLSRISYDFPTTSKMAKN